MVELVLLRAKDGNSALLNKATKASVARSLSANMPTTDENEKETILVKPTYSLDADGSEGVNEEIRRKTFSGGFSTFQKSNDIETPDNQGNISVTRKRSAEKEETRIVEWETIEILLEKTSGKGLGIGVTGGPKSRITDGMTVCLSFVILLEIPHLN